LGAARLEQFDFSDFYRVGDVSRFLGSLELQYPNLSNWPNIGELPKELGGLAELQIYNTLT
jgi:hypothetical protein